MNLEEEDDSEEKVDTESYLQVDQSKEDIDDEGDEGEDDEDSEIMIFDGVKYKLFVENNEVYSEDGSELMGTFDGESIEWKPGKYKLHKKFMKESGVDKDMKELEELIEGKTDADPDEDLEEDEESKPPKETIKYFSKSKDNKWLSTFSRANEFMYGGKEYPTVEHAFHAQKLKKNSEKLEEYQKLFTNKDLEPNEAKKLGSKKYFKEKGYELRSDWNDKRVEIMKECTEAYYDANDEMKKRLIATGDKELIHTGFRIDDFWGVKKDKGENRHGKILMELREKFKEAEEEAEEEAEDEDEDEGADKDEEEAKEADKDEEDDEEEAKEDEDEEAEEVEEAEEDEDEFSDLKNTEDEFSSLDDENDEEEEEDRIRRFFRNIVR